MKPDFGTKLIEVRNAKGLTQEDVAEKCKINVRTIQRIESGVVKPRAFTIKIISDVLGIDFFDASNTGYDVDRVSQSSNLKNSFQWYLKDLFNLKTKAMKKISILTSITLIICTGLFAISSNVSAQQETPISNKSVTVFYNSDKTVKRIEVRFLKTLTYDSLVNIKNVLKSHGIPLNYKRLEFDENNHLKGIGCGASTKVGSGSFDMVLLTANAGFFVDYSKGAKQAFCIGGCY